MGAGRRRAWFPWGHGRAWRQWRGGGRGGQGAAGPHAPGGRAEPGWWVAGCAALASSLPGCRGEEFQTQRVPGYLPPQPLSLLSLSLFHPSSSVTCPSVCLSICDFPNPLTFHLYVLPCFHRSPRAWSLKKISDFLIPSRRMGCSFLCLRLVFTCTWAHPVGWFLEQPGATSAGRGVGRLEPLCTVAGSTGWCSDARNSMVSSKKLKIMKKIKNETTVPSSNSASARGS